MSMMPLSMAKEGEPNVIKKVGGKEETRQFLENLGFVTGGMVTVISQMGGNLIVNIKESRVAIGKDMAKPMNGSSCELKVNLLSFAPDASKG